MFSILLCCAEVDFFCCEIILLLKSITWHLFIILKKISAKIFSVITFAPFSCSSPSRLQSHVIKSLHMLYMSFMLCFFFFCFFLNLVLEFWYFLLIDLPGHKISWVEFCLLLNPLNRLLNFSHCAFCSAASIWHLSFIFLTTLIIPVIFKVSDR